MASLLLPCFSFGHVDSRPIEISVAGADVKNISAFRVNEVRDVGCTVDSCLTSQYTVRFLSPSGTELLTETSSSMMMTFNWQASITRDITGGNYTCEVLMGGSNDSAVFSFVGECVDHWMCSVRGVCRPLDVLCERSV